MSYLIRTANGRNNIAYTTTLSSSSKILTRTGTGRNNIAWDTLSVANLTAANIRNGVTILGVTGTCKDYKTWTGRVQAPSSSRQVFPDVGGNTFWNYAVEVAPGFTPAGFAATYEWQPDSATYPSWNYNSCFLTYSGVGNHGEIRYSDISFTASKLTIPVSKSGYWRVIVWGYT